MATTTNNLRAAILRTYVALRYLVCTTKCYRFFSFRIHKILLHFYQFDRSSSHYAFPRNPVPLMGKIIVILSPSSPSFFLLFLFFFNERILILRKTRQTCGKNISSNFLPVIYVISEEVNRIRYNQLKFDFVLGRNSNSSEI